jgi:hypothetical protein
VKTLIFFPKHEKIGFDHHFGHVQRAKDFSPLRRVLYLVTKGSSASYNLYFTLLEAQFLGFGTVEVLQIVPGEDRNFALFLTWSFRFHFHHHVAPPAAGGTHVETTGSVEHDFVGIPSVHEVFEKGVDQHHQVGH